MSESHNFQRANTDQQREERRQAILRAAYKHLAEVGYERFSMGSIAEAVGLARGTLYLYFPNREELLFVIFLGETSACLTRVESSISLGMSVEELVAACYRAMKQTPLFLELAPHVGNIIEQNISNERFIEGKLQNSEQLGDVGSHVAGILGIEPERGANLLIALLGLNLGLRQLSKQPDIDFADLPVEICKELTSRGEEQAFLQAARWLVEGIKISP